MEEIKELTPEKLKEITANGKVVLLFLATWCPDCRFLDPFLPQIEKEKFDYLSGDTGSYQRDEKVRVVCHKDYVSF